MYFYPIYFDEVSPPVIGALFLAYASCVPFLQSAQLAPLLSTPLLGNILWQTSELTMSWPVAAFQSCPQRYRELIRVSCAAEQTSLICLWGWQVCLMLTWETHDVWDEYRCPISLGGSEGIRAIVCPAPVSKTKTLTASSELMDVVPTHIWS